MVKGAWWSGEGMYIKHAEDKDLNDSIMDCLAQTRRTTATRYKYPYCTCNLIERNKCDLMYGSSYRTDIGEYKNISTAVPVLQYSAGIVQLYYR